MGSPIRNSTASRFGAEQAGYSLIETMIALAISLICVAASVSWILFQNMSMSIANARIDADETVSFAAYEVYRIWSQAGGGSVKPWAAVWEEDNCPARGPLPICDGSDRLTLAELDVDLPECPLIRYEGASGDLESTEIEDFSGGGPVPTRFCCLDGFAGRQIYVTDEGNNTTARYVRSVNSAACTAQTDSVQQASYFRFPQSGAFPDMIAGVISPVTISTYYLDRNSRQLYEWSDANNDNTIDSDERKSIAADIFDLQIALGYDSSPATHDGVVTDTRDAADEWLYNAPGDAMGSGMLTSASLQDLQQIAFSIAAGTKVSGEISATNSRFDRWNGPVRDTLGWQLYGRSRVVVLRNVRLMEEF